jgi:phage gpG-like protein
MPFSMSVDLSELRGVQRHLLDASPAWDKVGRHMLFKSIPERFRSETTPDGRAWQPLAPSTIRAKQARRRGGRGKGKGKGRGGNLAPATAILRDTNEMRDTIKMYSGPTSMTIGTELERGVFHQFGLGPPTREWLGVTEADRGVILGIFADWVGRR